MTKFRYKSGFRYYHNAKVKVAIYSPNRNPNDPIKLSRGQSEHNKIEWYPFRLGLIPHILLILLGHGHTETHFGCIIHNLGVRSNMAKTLIKPPSTYRQTTVLDGSSLIAPNWGRNYTKTLTHQQGLISGSWNTNERIYNDQSGFVWCGSCE